ncbi:hypothetical protein WN944_008755 [Citrus x changshan-huyou]|uniref:Uncharacterized protein n=1 Tax=Citrus x changshan-huyou TaxID=2935761 RepID=A0AAP0MUT1_9ROSI
MKFNLLRSFPLHTTERVFWRVFKNFYGLLVVQQMESKGNPQPNSLIYTHIQILQEKGIRMRDGDIDGDYLDRQL